MRLLSGVWPRSGAARRADNRHRLAAIARQQPFGFEQAVRFGDRHRVHRVRHRELAHRRQLRAGLELAARDHAPHLLENLPVDRHARLGDSG